MSLTAEELDKRLAAFRARKDAFVALGHDGARAAAHAFEGGTHPEGPVTLDWARGYLAAARLAEAAAGEEHHERFATFRKPEPKESA